MVHGRSHGDIDILRTAPTTAQINRPAPDKGVGHAMRLEQHGYEARGEAQLQEVGGVGWVVQLREAVRVVNLSHLGRRRTSDGRCEIRLVADRARSSGVPSFCEVEEGKGSVAVTLAPLTPVGEYGMTRVMIRLPMGLCTTFFFLVAFDSPCMSRCHNLELL